MEETNESLQRQGVGRIAGISTSGCDLSWSGGNRENCDERSCMTDKPDSAGVAAHADNFAVVLTLREQAVHIETSALVLARQQFDRVLRAHQQCLSILFMIVSI